MPKKRGRSVEGRRKATTKKAGTRRAVRASVDAELRRAVERSPQLVTDPVVERSLKEPDVELWTPPTRPAKPKPVGNRFSARPLFVNHPEVPTDDLFIAPPQSKLTNRELGFDAKGKCLYGCDGMRSIKKGYTNIACHHYQCGFWETVDGKTKTPF